MVNAKQEIAIRVLVNGVELESTVAAESTLLDFLRQQGGIVDVKCGCNKGDCGTCTVVYEGQTVKSCLVLAASANNKEVWTLKGLEDDPLMKKLQASFVSHGAVQCGFCIPGMLVSSRGCLMRNPQPSRSEIREAISGNLCRCTGYQKIVDAVWAVATETANEGA